MTKSTPPGPTGAPAAVVETHSAVIFFFGDRVYKVKKPVDLGFLNFTTLESRRKACHDEVRLNRRLAPDVYLGVADVVGDDQAVCDHLVVMRRMPDDLRLSTLVADGVDVTDALRSVARQIAALHAGSERSAAADRAASAAALRARWSTNTEEMLVLADEGFLERGAVEAVHALAMRYVDGREDLFDERVAKGRAVDGHGDLLADDIFCEPDGARVLDCLDFDERLRLDDGLADAAFLAMDLDRLGRTDLSSFFLDCYREHAADSWPPSLAHHHIAYRAQVRAKVEAIRGRQGGRSATEAADRLLELARKHLDAARVKLVLVGGLPGTGKSTLAAGIAQRLDAVLLRSDEVRKELAGVASLTSMGADYGQGIYGRTSTAATYDRLMERAQVALRHGHTVVIDASWSDETFRTRPREIAADSFADLFEIQCSAPSDVAARRIRERSAGASDASDATPEIAAEMADRWSAWPTATAIDTSGPLEDTMRDALSALSGDDPSA